MSYRLKPVLLAACVIAASQIASAPSATAGFVYKWDVDLVNDAIGCGVCNIAGIVHFDVIGGRNMINGIEVAWGAGGAIPTGIDPGQSFRWFVWGDPNDDKSPAESNLLTQGTATVEAAAINNAFQAIAFPAVSVTDSFFVGVAISQRAASYPLGFDYEATAGHSWLAGEFNSSTLVDPTDLTGSDFFQSLNPTWQGGFMLRALAVDAGGPSTQVPVPGTLGLLVLGLTGLAAAQRRCHARNAA